MSDLSEKPKHHRASSSSLFESGLVAEAISQSKKPFRGSAPPVGHIKLRKSSSSSLTSIIKLKPNDVIILIKEISNGQWLCDCNGTSIRLCIAQPMSLTTEEQSETVVSEISIPEPPPLPSSISMRRTVAKAKGSRYLYCTSQHPRPLDASTRECLAQDVSQLKDDLRKTRMELGLIIKCFIQDFTKSNDEFSLPSELKVQTTPETRMFEKMLETPFVPTVRDEVNTPNLTGIVETINAEQAIEKATLTLSGEEVALAPPGQFFYRDILVPAFNLNSVSQSDLEQLTSLDFDVFPYHDEDNREYLRLMSIHMFHRLGLIEYFKIDEICLYRFLRTISSRYRSVPFHNWFHAFNVTQTMFHFLTECQAQQILGPLEILALLVATLCHDADHPGLNNTFQSKASTKIATLHKKSTLENHHLLHGYAALSNPESNIVAKLIPRERDLFMRYMRDLILSTDLALHGIILRNMKERKKQIAKMCGKWGGGNQGGVQTGGPSVGGMSPGTTGIVLDAEDTIVVMCCLIKCADLSNEIRPRQVAVKWAKMVMQEFIRQSQTETTMDLPVTAFMDPSKIIIAKEQINFISNLCMPLYLNLATVLPVINNAIRQMQSNLAEWEHRLQSFYTAQQAAQSSNKSIWERNQVKDSKQKLSELLGKQASHK